MREFYFQYDCDITPTETYLSMEKLVQKGLVRDIGLSNFNSKQVEDILKNAKVCNLRFIQKVCILKKILLKVLTHFTQ